MTHCYACIHRGGYADCGSDQCRLEHRLEDMAHAINDMKPRITVKPPPRDGTDT